LAGDAPVTAAMVDASAIVDAAVDATAPLEWAQMTEEEQRQAVKDAEGRLGPEWDRQRCIDWVRLLLKRIRSPMGYAAGLPFSEGEKAIPEKLRELVTLCEKTMANKAS
jgi:hypothetical protein